MGRGLKRLKRLKQRINFAAITGAGKGPAWKKFHAGFLFVLTDSARIA